MLDWRGMIGTSLIHGAAIVGWPVIDGRTTLCMCRTPGQDVMTLYDVPDVRRVSVFPIASQPDGMAIPVAELTKTCGGPAERTPIMVAAPAIPPRLALAGPIAFCASVDTTGRVTALRLLRPGEHSMPSVAAVRDVLRDARFAPVAAATRVELALTN